MMTLDFTGRRVLITGASRSIGRVLATAFAEQGAAVALLARDGAALEAVKASLAGPQDQHRCSAVDLIPEGAAAAAVRALMEEDGPFDVVIHNIGGPLGVRDVLAPASEWNRVWRLNVGIAIEINEVVAPGMVERKYGRLVHVSSVSAYDYRGGCGYAAAKAYLNAYVAILGRGLAPTGVVASGVMPGAVHEPDGPWEKKLTERPDIVADFLRHHQAIGRLGRSEELAPFVLLLASEHSSFATGCMLPIHGGTM